MIDVIWTLTQSRLQLARDQHPNMVPGGPTGVHALMVQPGQSLNLIYFAA